MEICGLNPFSNRETFKLIYTSNRPDSWAVLIPSQTGKHSNDIVLVNATVDLVLIPSQTGKHSNNSQMAQVRLIHSVLIPSQTGKHSNGTKKMEITLPMGS